MEFLQHWKIEYTQVDSTDPRNYAEALRPNTRVVYAESPANPTCRTLRRICIELEVSMILCQQVVPFCKVFYLNEFVASVLNAHIWNISIYPMR